MTKRIVLCADDYGQAEAVSSGILALLDAGRLTAVSCLVNQPRWREHAAGLIPYKEKADIGLHLNFTLGAPLSTAYRTQIGTSFMPLSRLLWRTMTRSTLLQRDALSAEIEAQLDAFTAATGVLPRFIDGHQHIHHLPVIGEVLLAVYQKRLHGTGVYVRAVSQDLGWHNFFVKGIKPVVIACTGGSGFAGRLDTAGIRHNTSFAGIYSFKNASHYRETFLRFLRDSTDHGLIMCHPGHADDDKDDPICRARICEYNYLQSFDFTTDCQRSDVILTRF
jgi:predicted glycoside hydrolase/deacetylase ChbG (UPF0249 family)